MAIHEISPLVDAGAQIELILDNSKGNDIVAMTDEIDFQSATTDVTEGIHETIEDAIHTKFFNTGSPYGSYFEFVNYLDAEDVEASGFAVDSNPISMRWFRLTSTPPA